MHDASMFIVFLLILALILILVAGAFVFICEALEERRKRKIKKEQRMIRRECYEYWKEKYSNDKQK